MLGCVRAMEFGMVLKPYVKEVSISFRYFIILTCTHLLLYLYFIVCPLIDNPTHGYINCSTENYEVATYEDTCNITCITGYELTGNDIRTYESDGNWSGTETNCTKS